MPTQQRDYIHAVVTSQMFEIFLQDTRSTQRKRLFDEYIKKQRTGGATVKNRSRVSGGRSGSTTSISSGKSSSSSKPKMNVVGNKSTTISGASLLDSTQWQNPTIIVPRPPCAVGLKEGRVYCQDRRFPDHLNPRDCITTGTISSRKKFCSRFSVCSAFQNCTW